MAKKMRLGTSWMAVNDVRSLLDRSRQNGEQMRTLLELVNSKVGIRSATLKSSLKSVPSASRDIAIASGVSSYRGDLKAETANARTGHVRSAAEMRETALAVKPHYKSPAQLLARHTLGSERRSRIMQQIDSSGHAELLSFAELAVATGDKDLGAALGSRVFAMAPDDRPFDVNELASALVGEEWQEVNKALDEVEGAAIDALRLDRDFETGRLDGTDMIEKALRQRQAEELYGEDSDDGEP
jgi:hypothetical protein